MFIVSLFCLRCFLCLPYLVSNVYNYLLCFWCLHLFLVTHVFVVFVNPAMFPVYGLCVAYVSSLLWLSYLILC